ncbi:MAG: hypothetical protein K2O44_06075 [Clostridia bacterium]|nr:hypothetical protein [Clostridia bacterium]
MNNAGTSTPEQSIFYYIQRFFTDAQNRYQYKINNNYFEIDIYIPSIKVAIEYDGALWHKDKLDEDSLKNLMLNKSGLYVIRVRDLDCPELPDFYGKIFYHGKSPKGMHTNEYIELIIHDIAQFCADKDLRNKLLNFKLTFEDYIKDSPDIMSRLYPIEVVENKSQFCGAEFWDTQANGRLSLKNIPSTDKSRIYVDFKCKLGYKIHTEISILRNKNECDKNCTKCSYSICPFIWFCENQCKIIQNILNDYLFGGELLCESFFKSHIWEHHLTKTSYLVNYIQQSIQFKDNVSYKKRFEDFFITDNEYIGKIFYDKIDVKITSAKNLSTIKEFYKNYHTIVNFRVSDLQETKENIIAIKDYLQWIFDMVDEKQCIFIGHRVYGDWQARKIFNNPMCDDLKNIIKQFIDKIEIRYNYKFRVRFD